MKYFDIRIFDEDTAIGLLNALECAAHDDYEPVTNKVLALELRKFLKAFR